MTSAVSIHANNKMSTEDVEVLNLLFNHVDSMATEKDSVVRNAYFKINIDIARRNPILWLIPSMYSIAKGDRQYVEEHYGKMVMSGNDRQFFRQIATGNIPHHRTTMPTMSVYAAPDIYGSTLFNGYGLSPINRNNIKFYSYRVIRDENNPGFINILYKPKLYNNTQLVGGVVTIDAGTGHITEADIMGEFDMIKFHIHAKMNTRKWSRHPVEVELIAQFKFLGNNINAKIYANLDCKKSVNVNIGNEHDIKLMSEVRPKKLRKQDNDIYAKMISRYSADSIQALADTIHYSGGKRKHDLKDKARRVFDDYFWTSLKTSNERGRLSLSPIINPLALGYTSSKGISYKMKAFAFYQLSGHSSLSFTPMFGMNFKHKDFIFLAPLRWTYSHRKEAWLQLVAANSSLVSALPEFEEGAKQILGDSAVTAQSVIQDYYKPYVFAVNNNLRLSRHVSINIGMAYTMRVARDKARLRSEGKKTTFRSLTPSLTLTLKPFTDGPLITASYERSMNHIVGESREYEKLEFDASFSKSLSRLRKYNLRAGTGFYTKRSPNYFVSYSNFSYNYLPEDVIDDWSMNFQLLPAEWYTLSNYYIRGNASFESPLMVLSKVPLVGRYVETERFYASVLSVEHSKLYSEIGYGFLCRYFAIGVFSSFLSARFQKFGVKFNFELFRRW